MCNTLSYSKINKIGARDPFPAVASAAARKQIGHYAGTELAFLDWKGLLIGAISHFEPPFIQFIFELVFGDQFSSMTFSVTQVSPLPLKSPTFEEDGVITPVVPSQSSLARPVYCIL